MIIALAVGMIVLSFIVWPIAAVIHVIIPALPAQTAFDVLMGVLFFAMLWKAIEDHDENRQKYAPKDTHMTPGLWRRDMRRGRNIGRGRMK
jgi:hypothetical protein